MSAWAPGGITGGGTDHVRGQGETVRVWDVVGEGPRAHGGGVVSGGWGLGNGRELDS